MLFVVAKPFEQRSPVKAVEYSFQWLWLELAAGRPTDLGHYLALAADTLQAVRPTVTA